MRISKMITLKRNALILYQILSTNSLTKRMEISLENWYSKIILSFKGPPLQQECGQKHASPAKPNQARLAKVLAGLARKAWPGKAW